MKRSTACALAALLLLALLVRLSPLTRYVVWGADTGEYYRITADLFAAGHVPTTYTGWGATYPDFPGMELLAAGLAFGGVGLEAAVSLVAPVLASLAIPVLFLLAARVLHDERSALAAAALLAVAMPHAYPTSHPMPAALGDLLVVAALLSFLGVYRDRRWLVPFLLLGGATIVTHHLSTYFLLLAAGGGLTLHALVSRPSPRTLLRVYGAVVVLAAATMAYWLLAAPLFRRYVMEQSLALPVAWAVVGVALAGLVPLGAILVRPKLPRHAVPRLPPERGATLRFASAAVVVPAALALFAFVPLPGTTVRIPAATVLAFLPLLVLLAFASAGRRLLDFARGGIDVSAWALLLGASLALGAFVASTVLIPYRHVEYLLFPVGVFAGAGMARRYDAGETSGARRGTVAAVVVLLMLSAFSAIPSREVLAGHLEGITAPRLAAVSWTGANADGLVASDHVLSMALFGYARTNATWDAAPLALHAPTFDDARPEMECVMSPSGERAVDYVLIDGEVAAGAMLLPWEPALPLSEEALAKFDGPGYRPVFDDGNARLYLMDL